MSLKDGRDYLYLIWKDNKSRGQYIVGQLKKMIRLNLVTGMKLKRQ